MVDRLAGGSGGVVRRPARRVWPARHFPLTLFATVMLGTMLVMAAGIASAAVFSFTRTDYLLDSYAAGLGSVAVGDLDGKNGPDIVVDSYTGLGFGPSTVNVLLNNGDGTFAPAESFDTCDGVSSIVVGQFNPSTDSHLDVAMICGNTGIGRMLGDGQGNLGAVQTVDVGYLGGASPAAIIDFLRLGAMNGPTLVYAGYLAPLGETLCFLTVPDLEYDLEHGTIDYPPVCNVHYNDIVGNPDFGNIDDFGPVSADLAVGPVDQNQDDPLNRDEALSGGSDVSQIPFAVTGYTPFYASTWSYGARASGITGFGAAVAIADLDGDHQNDLLMGGEDKIADYVPGFPIDQGATPTHTFASIPYLYDMVTADFDGDGTVDIAAVGDDDDNDDGITVGDPARQRRRHLRALRALPRARVRQLARAAGDRRRRLRSQRQPRSGDGRRSRQVCHGAAERRRARHSLRQRHARRRRAMRRRQRGRWRLLLGDVPVRKRRQQCLRAGGAAVAPATRPANA